jgi:hypothetical protein
MLLGAPGTGKTHIGKKFQQHGYHSALIDNYFKQLLQQQGGEGPHQVSFGNPQQRQMFRAASKMFTNDLYGNLMPSKIPIVTEKTGRNLYTIEMTKDNCDKFGYDLYGILIDVPLETALARNKTRTDRQVDEGELESEYHQIYAPGNIEGMRKIFGDQFFFTVSNDGTPAGEQQINQVVQRIVNAPTKVGV